MAATLSAILGAIGSAASYAGGAAASAGTAGGATLGALGSTATGLGATELGTALSAAGAGLAPAAAGGAIPAGISVAGPGALSAAESGIMFPAGAAGPTAIPASFGAAGGGAMPGIGAGMMNMINKSAAQGDALMNHPTNTLVKAITGSEKNDPLAGMLDKVLTPSMLMGKPAAPAQGSLGRGPGNLQPQAATQPSLFKVGPDGTLIYTGGA